MIYSLITRFNTRYPGFRPWFWKKVYQHLGKRYQDADWVFMNYGYADPDLSLELLEEDEIHRYGIQLYHQLFNSIDVSAKRVLEVGSGRGGGAHYVHRYLKPKVTIGLDLSEEQTALCNKRFNQKGLQFRQGNALELPFEDNEFDVVFNVESSHCYADLDLFFSEVRRVLKPGGYFLITDLRILPRFEELKKSLDRSGMQMLKERNITAQVVEALEMDNAQREAFIEKTIWPVFRPAFKQFAGTPQSKTYESLSSRQSLYLSWQLQA